MTASDEPRPSGQAVFLRQMQFQGFEWSNPKHRNRRLPLSPHRNLPDRRSSWSAAALASDSKPPV